MKYKLRILSPSPADLEEVIPMFLDMEALHYGLDPEWYAPSSQEVEKKVRRELARMKPGSNHQILIAKLGKEVVGFCTFGVERDNYHNAIQKRYGEVYELYVKPKWRDQGIGASLLAKVEQYFRAKGLKGIIINADAKNDRANAFYAKEGYRILTYMHTKSLIMNEQELSVKAVVFDFDDTLFQTREVKVQAFKYWARKFYGLNYTDKDIQQYWGVPFTEFVEKLVQGKDDLASAIKKYYSILPDYKTSAFPGTVETLKTLSKDFMLGIVSSSSKELVLSDMERGGFSAEFFSFIQGDEATTYHKPDPRVFIPTLAFFEEKGIKPEEIVYVGDSLSDWQAASAAGLNFIGIFGRGVTEEQWTREGARSIPGIQMLPKLLKKLS